MRCGVLALFVLGACSTTRAAMDAATPFDAGPQILFEAGCAPVVAPEAPSHACTSMTRTCLVGASTDDDHEACIDADPNAAACRGCLVAEVLYHCTTSGGCAAAYGCLVDCFAIDCPSGDPACTAASRVGRCSENAIALDRCLLAEQIARACGFTDQCFDLPDAGS